MLSATLLAFAVQVTGLCLEPDDRTIRGQRDLAAGDPCIRPSPEALRRSAPRRPVSGPLPLAQRTAIRNYFNGILFDGPSARWIWVPQRGTGGTYCGWVNAKNRLGAYTGWTPYYVMIDRGRVENGTLLGGGASPTIVDVFSDLCRRQGFDIATPPAG